ncbi:hypothetical protein LTS14_003227 [Recurvomyces mirabilis]|uniref:uncharacterized protein n=1 Tax=Recurvomyces mirabilis TaxID=574656 RepID=UPI002DE09979|nr:hypothetical protein LTS14_003227 [Recurvomyces mirabilis]
MSDQAKPKGKSTKITKESLDKPLPHEPLPDKSTSDDGQNEHVETSHADSGPTVPFIAQALRSPRSGGSLGPSDSEQDDLTSLSESALECMHTLSAPETTGPPFAEPKQDHEPKDSLSASGGPETTAETGISVARPKDAKQSEPLSMLSGKRVEIVQPRAGAQPLSLERLKKWFDTNIHVKISDADAVLFQSASDGENGGTLPMFQEAVLYAYQHIEPLQRVVKVLKLRTVELGDADTESWLPKDVVSGEPADSIDVPMRSKVWILQEASKVKLRERFVLLAVARKMSEGARKETALPRTHWTNAVCLESQHYYLSWTVQYAACYSGVNRLNHSDTGPLSRSYWLMQVVFGVPARHNTKTEQELVAQSSFGRAADDATVELLKRWFEANLEENLEKAGRSLSVCLAEVQCIPTHDTLVQGLEYSLERRVRLQQLAINGDVGRIWDPALCAASAEFHERLYILRLTEMSEALGLSHQVDVATLTKTFVLEAVIKTLFEQNLEKSAQENEDQ